ncbi:hypothetical protein [Amnibacterium endophyticum]|uniref:Heme exporter protein D n=1 Tax=Amnibacterium endophyticum TaxID=2109337 RepID=A0ABW4LEX5_9MICO
MGFGPPDLLVPLVLYAIVFAVVAVLAYLVIRFAVRDGLRGHTRWLEQREGRTPPPGGAD